MPILVWNDTFQLGINEIDTHHRHLVGLLNKSYDLYKYGSTDNTLASVIQELIDYANYHFDAEEYWMHKHSYPVLAEHKAQHESFTNKITTIHNDFLEGRVSLSTELFRFLANWVRSHILESDIQYGRYIADKGFRVW